MLAERPQEHRESNGTCSRHLLCQWVRRDCNKWRREKKEMNSGKIEGSKYGKDMNKRETVVRETSVNDGDTNNEQSDPESDSDIIKEGYKLEELVMEMNKNIELNKRKFIQEKMITTYGNVTLDANEVKFLELGPNFAMMEDLNLDNIRTEFMIALTKIRWGRMGKEENEVVRFRDVE